MTECLGAILLDRSSKTVRSNWTSVVKRGAVGATLLLSSCGYVDLSSKQSEDGLHTIEAVQTPVTTALSIGSSEFDLTYVGNFKDPVCRALMNTLQNIPEKVDLIVTRDGKYPSDILRRDILIDALRRTNLPFVKWKPIPDRQKQLAIFSAEWAQIGEFAMSDLKTESGGETHRLNIFDEPLAFTSDGRVTFSEWRKSSEHLLQESWPIRKFQLNKTYTLYDIKPEHPIRSFTEDKILNWAGEISPYFGSDYDIIGPAITMLYPFEKGMREIPLKDQLAYPDFGISNNYSIADLIWDGKYLTAISFGDSLSDFIKKEHSIKITKFNSADFITQSFFEGLTKPASMGGIQTQHIDMLLDLKSVDICDLKLRLKETTEE